MNLTFTKIELHNLEPGDYVLTMTPAPSLSTVKQSGERYSPLLDISNYYVWLDNGRILDIRSTPVVWASKESE